VTLPRLPMGKALRDALEAGTGKPCGWGGFPRVGTPAVPAEPPFTVLYDLPGTTYAGPPLDDDHADVEWVWQVTCVARRADQAIWLGDRVREVVLGKVAGVYVYPLVVGGMVVIGRRSDGDGGVDGQDGVVNYSERFALTVTGADA